MKNYQYVTALHGNEPIPTLALASMGIDQIVANPKALAQNKRYLEKEMNASFGTQGKSYEEKRAQEVMLALDKTIPVVDFHTFTAHSEPFAIVVDKKMLPLAKQTGLKHIVYMKHNIKSGHALINHVSGISVEVGQHTDPKGFEFTQSIVGRLEAKTPIIGKHIIYEVYDIITNPGKYLNFTLHDQGFYPVLAGENAYNHYGLKARLMEEI